MQENITTERQQGFSSKPEPEQEPERPNMSEWASNQERPQDLAWLIVEELRRKDAQIATLEALLQQQMAATPMEHKPRPEAFAPNSNGSQYPAPFGAMPLPQRGAIPSFQGGAMVYDTPSPTVVTEAAPPAPPMAEDTPPVMSMVYDTLPVVPQPTRIRLADMKIEHSPIAHTVMQAATQRLTEHIPASDPTLRLEAGGGQRSSAPPCAADNGHARRNKMAAGLAFLAFAGTIVVLQTRAAKREPQSSVLSAAPDTSAVAGRKYLFNAPAAVNQRPRPLEILPAEPVPRAVKHLAERGTHIAVVVPAAHRTNPLLHAASAHLAPTSRRYAAVTPARHSNSAALTAQTQITSIRAAPSGKPVRDHQATSRSPAALPADTMTASAEVLPDNSPDTPADNSASSPRTSHSRHYRRYSAEGSKRRSSVYRYGENARNPFDYDAKIAHHPASGYDEKADAWIDKLPQ